MSRALVVIDVQLGMFTLQPPLHRDGEVVERIAGLLRRARAASMPIFHVQHDGGPGDLLAKGTPGWAHHPAVAPQPGEPVIEKQHSSAFHGTDFHAQLQSRGIDHLIVTGLQTEMCIDSACRHAVALGYRVTLVADAHSTYDSPVLPAQSIIDHHNQTMGSGFVALSPAADVSFGDR